MTHLILMLSALVGLAQGERVADFTARDSAGTEVRLAELRARGPVVVAFFPKPFTPGCTRQMAAFAAQLGDFAARGATVVAISGAEREVMARFKAELKAEFIFLPDPDGALMAHFGARQKPLRMSRRVTYWIERDGRVGRVFEGKAAADPAQILALPP